MKRHVFGPAPSGRAGFTLLEVLVVIAIIAIIAAVTVPAIRFAAEEDEITLATRRVEALFRLARDSALKAGMPVTVVIDSLSGLVWLDTEAPEELQPLELPAAKPIGRIGSAGWVGGGEESSPGTSLELPGSVQLEVPRIRTRFTFSRTGMAFGDSVVLRWAGDSRIITINPWTGDVIVR